jgi:hypothetical protein
MDRKDGSERWIGKMDRKDGSERWIGKMDREDGSEGWTGKMDRKNGPEDGGKIGWRSFHHIGGKGAYTRSLFTHFLVVIQKSYL